jgi:hypothetical protein
LILPKTNPNLVQRVWTTTSLRAPASEQQAADCRELSRLFEKATGSAAVMW